MAMYNVCPCCGANLDPGEKCDCQKEKMSQVATSEISEELVQLVKKRASYEPSIYEIEAAYFPAKRKLDDLIKRFGTDNGQRLKPKYLAQLIVEQMRTERFSVYCMLTQDIKREQPA